MRAEDDSGTEFYRLLDSRGAVIAGRIEKVIGLFARMRGLIGRKALDRVHGIWISPCNGIHTFGMRFAINVLVLDRELKILRVIRALPPGRIVLPVSGGHSVVEVAAGTLPDSLRFGETIGLARSTGHDSTSGT